MWQQSRPETMQWVTVCVRHLSFLVHCMCVDTVFAQISVCDPEGKVE